MIVIHILTVVLMFIGLNILWDILNVLKETKKGIEKLNEKPEDNIAEENTLNDGDDGVFFTVCFIGKGKQGNDKGLGGAIYDKAIKAKAKSE